jgi:ubiquinone/menaquinone biosynthesis C-methylase UbiE
MSPILVIALLVVLALFLYWQLVIAEGAYLGARVVAFLYDLVAQRYNKIKQFNESDDRYFLSEPLSGMLASLDRPWVLDVATGTGRLPLALLDNRSFRGRVVALDLAGRMLRVAQRALLQYATRVTLIHQTAERLPFADDAFDAVACLEALEFMPDPEKVMAECVRVLKPGGALVLTRRSGPWARWMPGRTPSKEQIKAQVEALGVWNVEVNLWQVDYDLVWGIKIAQWNK